MTAAASSLSSRVERPATIVWAVAIIVVGNLANFFIPLLPNTGDIPGAALVVGDIASVITILLCLPLWQCRKWGAIAVTVITILNTLTAAPGLLDPPSGTVVAIILTTIPLAIVPIWLIWHPSSRRAYRAR
ncbi:MAG: hypothetical protein ABI305_02405 [Tepidiformaceae bacterium]